MKLIKQVLIVVPMSGVKYESDPLYKCSQRKA